MRRGVSNAEGRKMWAQDVGRLWNGRLKSRDEGGRSKMAGQPVSGNSHWDLMLALFLFLLLLLLLYFLCLLLLLVPPLKIVAPLALGVL